MPRFAGLLVVRIFALLCLLSCPAVFVLAPAFIPDLHPTDHVAEKSYR